MVSLAPCLRASLRAPASAFCRHRLPGLLLQLTPGRCARTRLQAPPTISSNNCSQACFLPGPLALGRAAKPLTRPVLSLPSAMPAARCSAPCHLHIRPRARGAAKRGRSVGPAHVRRGRPSCARGIRSCLPWLSRRVLFLAVGGGLLACGRQFPLRRAVSNEVGAQADSGEVGKPEPQGKILHMFRLQQSQDVSKVSRNLFICI
mmetsp:Transcript_22646/g.64348  ORF Transcript_22646/g.64348 Transcript_22646/m.64348 type:complete len:204 (-) Transcript_22646:1573-2184(-)